MEHITVLIVIKNLLNVKKPMSIKSMKMPLDDGFDLRNGLKMLFYNKNETNQQYVHSLFTFFCILVCHSPNLIYCIEWTKLSSYTIKNGTRTWKIQQTNKGMQILFVEKNTRNKHWTVITIKWKT